MGDVDPETEALIWKLHRELNGSSRASRRPPKAKDVVSLQTRDASKRSNASTKRSSTGNKVETPAPIAFQTTSNAFKEEAGTYEHRHEVASTSYNNVEKTKKKRRLDEDFTDADVGAQGSSLSTGPAQTDNDTESSFISGQIFEHSSSNLASESISMQIKAEFKDYPRISDIKDDNSLLSSRTSIEGRGKDSGKISREGSDANLTLNNKSNYLPIFESSFGSVVVDYSGKNRVLSNGPSKIGQRLSMISNSTNSAVATTKDGGYPNVDVLNSSGTDRLGKSEDRVDRCFNNSSNEASDMELRKGDEEVEKRSLVVDQGVSAKRCNTLSHRKHVQESGKGSDDYEVQSEKAIHEAAAAASARVKWLVQQKGYNTSEFSVDLEKETVTGILKNGKDSVETRGEEVESLTEPRHTGTKEKRETGPRMIKCFLAGVPWGVRVSLKVLASRSILASTLTAAFAGDFPFKATGPPRSQGSKTVVEEDRSRKTAESAAPTWCMQGESRSDNYISAGSLPESHVEGDVYPWSIIVVNSQGGVEETHFSHKPASSSDKEEAALEAKWNSLIHGATRIYVRPS
uniref:Uncharacterized protein n=1 Tax=Polytomella parva TaxID=51329 RepID=A0A7S0VK01_9CHLO|mmetsp:Transcript_33770/g.60970  ORF Transcript_33770/g.60970 Transcript_33770/m.60970 type:complete len:573 (+) Transcript_33770:146-1864(+)